MKLGQELSEIDEPTKFVESNALLAIQGDEVAHALALVQSMYPHERRELSNAALRLADMCDRENGKTLTVSQRYAAQEALEQAWERAQVKYPCVADLGELLADDAHSTPCPACALKAVAEVLGIEVTG